MSAPRFYSEGGGRIYDREWEHPGYVVKVWARLDNGASLTDAGPAVQKQTDSILALLNESATLRALYAEAVRALAMATAPQSCDGGGSFTAFHFDTEGNEIGSEYVQCPGCCACASESTRAVLSRPEAQEVLRG